MSLSHSGYYKCCFCRKSGIHRKGEVQPEYGRHLSEGRFLEINEISNLIKCIMNNYERLEGMVAATFTPMDENGM